MVLFKTTDVDSIKINGKIMCGTLFAAIKIEAEKQWTADRQVRPHFASVQIGRNVVRNGH